MSNYFQGKEKRIVKAHRWYDEMKKLHQEETENSVTRTRHYEDLHDVEVKTNRFDESEIMFLETDTVSAIIMANLNDYGKICALNFASYKKPGGMFLGGSSAQEESLCHESNLYNVLENFTEEFYEPNRKRLNKALYNDNLLYSPDIVFIQGTKIGYSDVITCAAPNKGAAQKYQNVTDEECILAMKSRIDAVLKAAYVEEVETLILGAFGCGVFKNDPVDVATIFFTYLETKYKNCFKKVIFAIPCMKSGDHTMNTFALIYDKIRKEF